MDEIQFELEEGKGIYRRRGEADWQSTNYCEYSIMEWKKTAIENSERVDENTLAQNGTHILSTGNYNNELEFSKRIVKYCSII